MKKNIFAIGIVLTILTGCQTQLSINQLPFNQLSLPPIPPDVFLTSFLANFAADFLIALALYFIIDYRIQRRQEKRAYRVLFIILRRLIQKLDYLRIWLKNPSEEIPPRLRSSVYTLWKEWRHAETIQHFDPEFLVKFELALSDSDAIFETLDKLGYYPDSRREIFNTMMNTSRLHALSLALPLLRTVRKKAGDRWVNENKWRQKLQKEIVEIDEKVILWREKAESML